MQIIKRNGTTESYDREKIAVAIRKSFISTQKEITDEAVYTTICFVLMQKLFHFIYSWG